MALVLARLVTGTTLVAPTAVTLTTKPSLAAALNYTMILPQTLRNHVSVKLTGFASDQDFQGTVPPESAWVCSVACRAFAQSSSLEMLEDLADVDVDS